MGIKATCPCGAQFMAKPELAGRTVKCPTCGQAFQVPAAPAAPRQPAAFQVACTCGRTYQVQPAMAGRQVRCQACGGEFVVPQPPGARAPMPAAPVHAAPTTPAPDPLGDLGNLGDLSSFGDPLGGTLPAAGFPAQSLPAAGYSAAGGTARPKSKRKPINKTAVVSIITSVLVVLAILGIAVGTFIFFPFGKGYSSPQAVWNAQKKATERKDWGTLYNTLTPETCDRMLGNFLLMSQLLAARDEGMATILKKHGIEAAAPGAGGLGQMLAQGQQPQNAASSITNKKAFFVDVLNYWTEKGDEMREKLGGQKMPMVDASRELKDVVIEGDTARGMQSVSAGGNSMDIPVQFRKIDGGWLIHQ